MTFGPKGPTLLGAALAAALGLGGTGAQAALAPNGSFSGAYFGNATADGLSHGGTWQLGPQTQVVTIPGTYQISSAPTTYLGNTNNIAASGGGAVNLLDAFTLSTSSFNVASGALATALTLTLDTYTFKFTQEAVTTAVNGTIGIVFLGNLTADSTSRLTTPSAADFSMSFTQSSNQGAIGVTFSIDSPPNPSLVPEPASMAVLGVGLMGLAAARRRRRGA